MRALVIQHDHVSPPGPVGDRLRERLFDVVEHQVVAEEDFHRPWLGTQEFPDPRGFDAIVVMGAPWAAYDAERVGAWVRPELELLREADAARVPVLGICFGGQLLALAHGGEVTRAPLPEIGWRTIRSDRPEVVPPGPWFQWHYDCWRLPDGATELARNDAASQAFALRRNLAVQFHPELTPGMLHGWLGNGGDADARSVGVDPAELVADTAAEAPAALARAQALVDAFLARFAGRPSPSPVRTR